MRKVREFSVASYARAQGVSMRVVRKHLDRGAFGANARVELVGLRGVWLIAEGAPWPAKRVGHPRARATPTKRVRRGKRRDL